MSLGPQLQNVDRNLQAIKSIEGAWDLPALPDEVRLDLAGNTTMTPNAMGSLLTGIAADLEAAGQPAPLPTRDTYGVEEPVNPRYAYKPRVGLQVAGIIGVETPQVYSTGAHRQLKQRLADGGYLDLSPQDIESDRWLPEYSYAASQMNFDDQTRQFQGEKPGSMSVDGIMGVVDEWLSPRGLYRAAVELDLWWDAGQISEEFQSWDEKWAAVRDDPWNIRNWVDAVTGPLDDILFPALNIALLFTGVGELMAVGRGVAMGVKGAQALSGIHRGGAGARFAAKLAQQGADDIARFSQPGFLARKVPEGAKVGHVMEQWRKRSGVIVAKKANQQVMRMGFSSNLQQLIDADRGGKSIDHFTGGAAGERVYEVFSNPMLDWGVDLLFTPTNIWNPGTFSKPAKAITEAVQTGFARAANNEDLLTAWDLPVQEFLRETRGEDAVKEWMKLTGRNKAVSALPTRDRTLKRALAETFFDGNEELMGAALAYTTTMAGLEHWARNISDVMVGGPTHELTSASRRSFHAIRNQGIARLRHLDARNVEDMITHITKYGENAAQKVTLKGARNARQFNSNYRKVQEGYLESAEQAAARAGAVPNDHTRFIGRRNSAGRVEWHAMGGGEIIEDNPFFLDLHTTELQEFYGDNLSDVLSGAENLDDVFAHRYLRRRDDGALRHYRLSEADKVRLYDPVKLRRLQDLATHHNELRGKFMVEMMDSLTPEAISQYVYEVLPTFGRMGEFSEAAGEITMALQRGDLDNARFVSPMSETNRRIAAMPSTPNQEKWVEEMFGMMLELPNDEKLAGKLMESVFSPFARDVDPQVGSFTVMGVNPMTGQTFSATKQEALAFGATARRTAQMVKALRKLRAMPNHEDVIRVTRKYMEEGGSVATKTGLREVLAEALGSSMSEDRLSDLAALGRIADEAGVTLDDIEGVLMKKLMDVNGDARWAERYNVPTQLERVDDLVEEVGAKVKELESQAYFMASEVEDVPAELVSSLGSKGYKLVYGVEFAQPMDLDGVLPHIADASKKHIRQKTFGNFFSRQDPDYVSALKARKVREGLHAKLANLVDPGEGARALNLGRYPDEGNADLNSVMEDLYDILHEVQDDARHMRETLVGEGPIAKVAGRARLARIPFSLDRLASDLPFAKFVDKVVGKGYSKKQAIAMYNALQSSQALGVRMHGIYAIESKLRSSPNVLDALRFFGTTAEGDKFRVGRAVTGAVLGGYAGNVAATEAGAEPGSWGQLGGAAAGMALGGVLGGKSSRIGIPGIQSAADQLENSRFVRGAYLADGVANLRDMVRFSLSPMFDASRYSEAIILSQIGEMPEGLRNLRVNQSPSAFRKTLAREFRKEGMMSIDATRAAEVRWHQYQDEFAASARGYRDFEWEVIDGTGRRFSSIGILGFSPTDWMSSTFAHLRRAGVDQGTAYDTVREIYTYGTTGRSAAELSMNFVFFPFSFTKKTLGHMGKFFSDDIGRLIVLQDSLATYQMLDEEFDLSQEWKDRLPILEKAYRLNLLAYGVGLGRFGGVNAPFLETIPGFDEAKAGIVNAFIPQSVPMATAEDGDTAWQTARQMLPVINDVNTMISMAVEQGRVIGSESHMTSRAEQRLAWDEWRTFQEDLTTTLEEAGMTWDQATRNPETNIFIQKKRAEISAKYPAWVQGMGDGIAHAQAINMELNERLHQPQEPADALLAKFEGLLSQMEAAMGRSIESSPEQVPPEIYRLFRQLAIDYAKEDSSFLRLYNRFYRRSLGDITVDAA